MSALSPEIARQIDDLPLAPDRPVIVTDADEVLFQFMAGLERFLEAQGLTITLDSFAITGNVRRPDGVPVAPAEMKDLLAAFFEAETHRLDPVDGAAAALEDLREHADIVVLSNVPMAQHAVRAETLARHGMPYPLVANSGLKGPAMHAIAARAGRPAIFLDDIPHNLASVHETLGDDVHLIHFVADPRLRTLVPTPEVPHTASGDWTHAREVIAGLIQGARPAART